MTKFLATNLLEEKPSGKRKKPAKGSQKKGGKKVTTAVLLALLVIVIALGGYTILSKYVESKPQIANTEIEVPLPGNRRQSRPEPESEAVTEKQPLPESTVDEVPEGLKGVPWIGIMGPVLEDLSSVRGSLFSVVSGPEGVFFAKGSMPGESVKIDSRIISGEQFGNFELISTEPIEGGVRYIAGIELEPLVEIDFDPQPVPPYNRVKIMDMLDSLARNSGLVNIDIEALGQEKVPGGSRFSILFKGIGPLSYVQAFVNKSESCGEMIEISRFSMEGINGKRITEDDLSVGFVFRVYDLPSIAREQQSPTISQATDTSQ